MRILVLSMLIFIICINTSYAKQDLFHEVISIYVGECYMDVYTAVSDHQKMMGMLVFDTSTFDKDGMLFIGTHYRTHYYHTEGMLMDIMIMGVNKVGENRYIVEDEPIYSPPGLNQVKIKGTAVLEIPVPLYQNMFKDCLQKQKR